MFSRAAVNMMSVCISIITSFFSATRSFETLNFATSLFETFKFSGKDPPRPDLKRFAATLLIKSQ